MKSKDYTPLVMWFSLWTAIIVLGIFRSSAQRGVWKTGPIDFDFVFIGLYLVWMLAELRVTGRDVIVEGKKTTDHGTCLLYGSGHAMTIATALWFPSLWTAPGVVHIIAIGVFILAGCYRLWAVYTLGRYYSHKVRIVARHKIVASGPYQFTRHPAYAGMLFAHVGVCLYFLNWATLCIFLFVLVPAIVRRILIEEGVLFRLDGYGEYAKNRKRLIPCVW